MACDRTEAEIQRALGADGLLYQTLDDLIGAATDINPKITKFEDSVFSGTPLCLQYYCLKKNLSIMQAWDRIWLNHDAIETFSSMAFQSPKSKCSCSKPEIGCTTKHPVWHWRFLCIFLVLKGKFSPKSWSSHTLVESRSFWNDDLKQSLYDLKILSRYTWILRLFAGIYVTEDIDSDYLLSLEKSTRTKERALAEETKSQRTETLVAQRWQPPDLILFIIAISLLFSCWSKLI